MDIYANVLIAERFEESVYKKYSHRVSGSFICQWNLYRAASLQATGTMSNLFLQSRYSTSLACEDVSADETVIYLFVQIQAIDIAGQTES